MREINLFGFTCYGFNTCIKHCGKLWRYSGLWDTVLMFKTLMCYREDGWVNIQLARCKSHWRVDIGALAFYKKQKGGKIMLCTVWRISLAPQKPLIDFWVYFSVHQIVHCYKVMFKTWITYSIFSKVITYFISSSWPFGEQFYTVFLNKTLN